MSYSENYGITVESIQEEFDCEERMAERILAIYESGYNHGLAGLYFDDEPKYDDEWDCSTGRKIRVIEDELELDSEEVYAYYKEALNAGHNDSNGDNNLDTFEEDEFESFSIME